MDEGCTTKFGSMVLFQVSNRQQNQSCRDAKIKHNHGLQPRFRSNRGRSPCCKAKERRVAPLSAIPTWPRAQRDACRVRVSPWLQPAVACGSRGHRTYVAYVWAWLAYGGHYEMGTRTRRRVASCAPTRVRCTLASGPWARPCSPVRYPSCHELICTAQGTRVGHEGSFHIPSIGTVHTNKEKIMYGVLLLYCRRQGFQRYCSRHPAGMFRLVFPSFGGRTC
jgi:hypothetical protein